MVRFIALGFLVAYACHSLQAGGEPVPSSRDHKKAIEAFRELVKKGFRADYTDIEAKFNACFQANDRVSKFDKVFETATRREDRKDKSIGKLVRYIWEIKRKDETMWLIVDVGFDPPVVARAITKTSW